MKHRSFRTLVVLGMVASSLSARHCNLDQTMQFNVGSTFCHVQSDFGDMPTTLGYQAGIHTDLTYSKAESFYAQLQFDGSWNAGYIAGPLAQKSKVGDYRPEGLFGYNFVSSCGKMVFTPLIGFGYHHFSNELSPDIMTYNYHHLYIPIGFDFAYPIRDCNFEIGARVVARLGVAAWLDLETPLINLGNDDDDNDLDLEWSYGVRVEVPLTWHKTTGNDINWQVKVVPYFDWNHFGETEDTGIFNLPIGVPEVDRWQLGLHVDFGMRF